MVPCRHCKQLSAHLPHSLHSRGPLFFPRLLWLVLPGGRVSVEPKVKLFRPAGLVRTLCCPAASGASPRETKAPFPCRQRLGHRGSGAGGFPRGGLELAHGLCVFRAGGRRGLDTLCSLRPCRQLSQRWPISTCLISPQGSRLSLVVLPEESAVGAPTGLQGFMERQEAQLDGKKVSLRSRHCPVVPRSWEGGSF